MITEQTLNSLRVDIEKTMSPKRFRHTVEVEKMVERLGALYAPTKLLTLRAAALLHDITKEYSTDRQLMICAQKGLTVSQCDLYAPKTFHARTAAALIPDLYEEFAEEEVISCVRWHTTGRADMTLCEQLVYLADYIDLSRTFEDCVTLRSYFFDKNPESMDWDARLKHLRDTMILSFDMTLLALTEEYLPISPDTFEARNQLICQRIAEQTAN